MSSLSLSKVSYLLAKLGYSLHEPTNSDFYLSPNGYVTDLAVISNARVAISIPRLTTRHYDFYLSLNSQTSLDHILL